MNQMTGRGCAVVLAALLLGIPWTGVGAGQSTPGAPVAPQRTPLAVIAFGGTGAGLPEEFVD